jgi:putative PIN family toxin of toxin-antitoxin system
MSAASSPVATCPRLPSATRNRPRGCFRRARERSCGDKGNGAAEQRKFVLCISPEIIAETRNSLKNKQWRIRRYYDYPDAHVDKYVDGLGAMAEMVGDLPQLRVVLSDPSDDAIVATAVKAAADCLVTGDRHLLALGAYGSTRIVMPRQFLDLL